MPESTFPDRQRRMSAAGLLLGAALAISACQGLQPGSERVYDDRELVDLSTGITRSELIARLGPPSQEQTYKNLNETVDSWRVMEPGGRRMLMNAHLDPTGRVKYYSRTIDPAAADTQGD